MSDARLAVSVRLEARPRLDVYARLLPMDVRSLDDAAAAEVAENPFLEFALERSTASAYDPTANDRRAGLPSLADHLLARLAGVRDLGDGARRAAIAVVGSLDADGYCRESVAAIAAIARCPLAGAAAGLAAVQALAPSGIAARSLGERFALQLEPGDADARAVAGDLEALAAHGAPAFAERVGMPLDRVRAAIARLAVLERHPAAEFDAPPRYVRPEFAIERADGRWIARYDAALAPDVRYVPLAGSGALSDAMRAARAKARRFVDALERRSRTLAALGTALVDRQTAFFDAGGDPVALVPLSGRALAREIGCAESTVSRALANRHARTPFGVIPLRALIAVAPRATSALTTAEIERRLAAMISGERAPLSDRELARRLGLAGVRIARRTVAKYRTRLEIASTRKRRAR